MGFMWMLLLVAYGQRDPNAFFLNQHIRNSFSEKISDSMSLGEVFTWAKTSLLTNLFGMYSGKSSPARCLSKIDIIVSFVKIQSFSDHVAW